MKQELSNNKYLYKRLKLEEIKNPQYFFKLWTESNVIKFLIRLFFNKDNFIKLFDFRIISSLILRDFCNSKTNKSSILNNFLLITLSILFYRLSNKTIIEKKHLNLVKIVYARINYFKYKEKQLEGHFEKKKKFIFSNYYLFKFFDLKKKKFKPRFRYNKILFENSEWWKIWIIKEILPSWKISSNSIEKINNLLKKKNTNDLNFFFEFYINHLFYQNYDWENNFHLIFLKKFKKKKFSKNKKVLKNVLILEIFSAFCEKLIFEVESPLKTNKFNSIIKLDKNNTYPLFYKKKVNPELFSFFKKNLIQNLKFVSEADSIVIKSYIFIKKKKWNFFKNYAEFYIWQLYKNGLFQSKTNFNKFTTNKKKLNKKLFKINNKKNTLKKDNYFLEISYHMLKYILYKVKNFNKLTHNYKKLDQNFKLKKINEIKITKNFNLINTTFFQSKKKIVLTIWDTYFFLKKNENTLNSYNSFSNIWFIDESKMVFSPTKKYKYKKKLEIIKKQKKINFKHFLKSDNNRFVFLWKIKKNNQKLNFFLFLNYYLNIFLKKKFNNKTKVLIINSNSSTNIFYLIWPLIYKYINIDNYNKNIKYNKILLFQINYFVNLVSFVDNFNLFIIKYNLFNSKKKNCNINYQNKKKNKLKKKLLITNFFPIFYNKITNNSKLIYNNFFKNSIKSLNNIFLINKFFYNSNKIYLMHKKKIKINQILLNYNKTKKNQFYYNTIKKNIYIYWKFNKTLVLIDKKNKQKKVLNFFVKKQKNLILLSNKINFRNNKNFIPKWYNKLNKRNIYIFYRTFLLLFSTNFNKISKIFLFYHQNNNIFKKLFLKITFNKTNLIKQIKFNIYYKLKTKFNFDKLLITKFFINYLNNKKNQSYTKIFNKIFCFSLWQNQKIYFYFLPISNKNLINYPVFKVNTITLLNSLYYSNLSYKKKLKFYLKKKKKSNLTYIHLIKNIPLKLEKKKFLFSNQLTFFSKKQKNLNNKLQIYQFFLFKYFKNFHSKKLLFFHLNKLLNSLVKFNPVFSRKHKNLTNNNLRIQKHLKQYNNINQTTFFENKLLSEFFIQIQNENNQIDNWVNKLFLVKSNFTKTLINNNILLNKKNTKRNYKKKKFVLSFFQKNNNNNKLILQKKIIKTSNFFVQWNFFKKYISWFFTFQWWKYFQNLVSNLFLELLLNINDQFNYILFTILENKKIDYLLKNVKFNLKKFLLNNSVEIWNLRLLKQINKHHKNQKSESPCFSLNLINKWNKESLTIISLIIFSYFIFQKHFSILLGSEYLELWGYFQIIKYLIDSSRGIYLDNLIKHNSIQLVKSENLVIHFFKNFLHYLKYAKFYLFTNKKITNLLINNKGLDLSRRERKLLVQSLIADKKIDQYRLNLTSNINFLSFQLGDSIIKQHKFKNYLEKLTENYQKNLINYPFNKFYLAENLIFLSFWQKTTSLYVSGQFTTLRSTLYKKPIPLELKLFSSKGLLLIGSLETGRSYLVKTIAANSFVPLIKISINKLLYNKPDIITESWMNILMESLRRLNLILELAEKLSPCIIWMQNIHELNVNRLTQNVESDPTFLLGIFLKYFQTVLKRKYTSSLVIIGSTHLPKKVDPALISPNRLDQLINIRMSNILQRQKKISNLLHSQYSNYFYSKKKKSCINEFGYRTMGYNARDLSGLINEILLISIAQNQNIIEKKIIRLAFHRQALGSTYINNQINFTQNYGILFYKVGKVIIQNFFLKNFSRNPLYFGNDLWKKKFYYLSKWYLEPSIFESTIKEFTILPHILGCLAGLAARDSWFILENKPDNLISLDKFAENDFYLACGILESFLIEFSWLEIQKNKTTNKTKKLNFQFQKKNPLYLIKKGLFSITNQNKKSKLLNKSVNQTILYKKQFYQLSSNISWAPKISRLNFIRTTLFNWINRPNDFEITYNLKFLNKKENKKFNVSPEHSHFFEIIQHKTKEQLPYERILSRIRRRNVQELELQLEDILLDEQFVILGFSQLFTEYRMESQLSNKPMIFIGGRFLWDPAGLSFQENNFVFSRQKLFIDEEMLRRLYVTYGARREREKSRSSQKIKQFFLRRGYGRDSINDFSINWWNQLPFIEKNNIETFKRIEGIGVQLKRPQVFTPVYLYQRWLIENPRENLTRFSFLNNQQRWLKVNNLLLNDSFIYNTLLEIYHYLVSFFILHQILLNQMTKLLLKNKWLFHDDIKYFINMFKKIN
jgi:hypothetical protein